MSSIIAPKELLPVTKSADFAVRFGKMLARDAQAMLGNCRDLRIASPMVAERLWSLSQLVFGPHASPDPVWSESLPLLDIWTHGLKAAAIHEAVAAWGLAADADVFIVIDDTLCPEAIAAPWHFCLDTVLPVNELVVVMPPDASWMLTNYHGELVRAVRTRFAMVRSITFRNCYFQPNAAPVRKPRYEVLFRNGTTWESGDLRCKADLRRRLDSSLLTVAGLVGTSVAQEPF